MLPKAIVILGQTATGKSDLAVLIAKKVNGEIISADSRQIYKGLNIGSGKITKTEMRGVKHHMLDVSSPKRVFSVSQFQKQSKKAVEDMLKRGKVPIICGGTGFYIDTLIENKSLPEVPPNKELRQKLDKKNLSELLKILKNKDPKRFKEIDQKNKRRIIRSIEIANFLGKVPSVKNKPFLKCLKIGLKDSKIDLKNKIKIRLLKRIKAGMIKEVERIHQSGVSFKRLDDLGLEYRYVARYLQNKISKEDMISQLEREINKFAKRQETWFKRDKETKWIKPNDHKKALEMVTKFLS